MIKSIGYAARNATTPLTSLAFEREEVGASDVQIDILYCGVCHSDLHQVRDEWHNTDDAAMSDRLLSFDFILSTIPVSHDINPYINLLKRDATLTLVGALEPLAPVDNSQVAFHRRSIAGSLIGGIAETQDLLDFCAERNIVSDVEIIPIQQINEAYERMLKGDVKYRFVIDMASLRQEFDRQS